MKILKDVIVKGKRHVLVEVDANEKLIAINEDAYYKLGEPMHEEVFAGHILADASLTCWCSIEQKWIS